MRVPFRDTYRKNKEAKSLIENAQSKYDRSRKKMERQRQQTSDHLESLGKMKLQMLSDDIGEFTKLFQHFKDVRIEGKIIGREALAAPVNIKINVAEMQRASINAAEVFKGGAASLSAGALAGVASYGAVSMLGSASTGAAISSLQGIAAHNATLAWFGGGSIASGGAGIAGGTLVLGGIMVVPILLVADSIMSAKADERLAEAEKIYQEAKLVAEKMNTVTDFMVRVKSLSEDYMSFLSQFKMIYSPLLQELRRLIQELPGGMQASEKVSFNSLTAAQKRLLHITFLMTQVLYNILKTPLLTKKGNIQDSAGEMLKSASQVTSGLLHAYDTNSEIDAVTWEAYEKMTGTNAGLSQKISNIIQDIGNSISHILNGEILEYEPVRKVYEVFSKLERRFLGSGTAGFLSLVVFIIAILALLSGNIISGIIWMYAGYAAYSGSSADDSVSSCIKKTAVIFVIGLIVGGIL